MTKAKTAQSTETISTRFVLPNDTNMLNNLFGGSLMAWMDEIAAICAHRHCQRVVVTASVNNVSFTKPIRLGDMVTLKAKISRAYTSSMEVYVDVYVDSHKTGERMKSNEAIFNFVAVDQNGRPIDVPGIIPETDEEKERFEGALRRKQLSLVLAGKMKPSEAKELKALFDLKD